MELFLDESPEFEKEAGFSARLSEAPENWPQELSSELFKQLPFLSDYNVNVNLDRVEPNRGYAFGYADVSNKTERPEIEHEESGLPHIRIPIIVIEQSVKPFSVFLDGEKVLPLTEERLRETLFNPSTFDLSTSQPRDPSLVEPLMPPNRTGVGMGGEYKMAASKCMYCHNPIDQKKCRHCKELVEGYEAQSAYSKSTGKKPESMSLEDWEKFHPRTKKAGVMGAGGLSAQEVKKAWHGTEDEPKKVKKASLLERIAPTMRESDVSVFTEKISSDPYLISRFKKIGMAQLLVDVCDKTKRASADDLLQTLAEQIEPTVVTIHKLPGNRFLVKSANVNAFAGGQDAQGQVVEGDEAGEAMGEDQAQAMQPGQTVTAVSNPVADIGMPQSTAKIVEEFGEFKVQDSMGNQLLGWVFPNSLAWDGSFTPQPIAVFTNGSAYAVQETIAGELVGKGTNLPRDTPRGDGVFYVVDGGNAVCTAPVTIGSSAAGPDGLPRFVGTDVFGNQLMVSQVEGLKVPQRISDSEYALPENWKFMRLNNQTQLVPDPVQFNKSASARLHTNEVTLFYNGAYHLEGGCGLDKIAGDFRLDLDAVGAEFILGLLGVDGVTSKAKVAEARKKGSVKLANLLSIKTLGERYAESEKVASSILKQFPDLRVDLIKEAASLEDESTVDKVLALNFINPDNIMEFVNALPEFQECSEKLAEMLLYSYIGAKEIPEGAVERAMKNLELVITELKSIQHAET